MNSKRLTFDVSRRDFLKTTAAASLFPAGGFNTIYAGGSDTLRVGVLGCGSRGIYDSERCIGSAKNVKIVALADLFSEQVEHFHDHFKTRHPDNIDVPPENRFHGFEAYHKLLACDFDLVLMTQPPHFRPLHFKAAIQAGKHVFLEKPVAVDPAGVHSILQTAQLADQKNLTVVAGTQMRRLSPLVEIIKRIHNGDLGSIVAGQTYRMGGGMTDWGPQIRQNEWSDMEWQIRRWLFYTWLSGDFIVEQHVHNLDLINWAMGSHPIRCCAVGGRQSRTDAIYGDVYDHMAVEYIYSNGVRIFYKGAQIDGMSGRNDQRLFGSQGTAYFDFGRAVIEGPHSFEFQGDVPDPTVLQHADQINAIRSNTPLNEAVQIAESSMTAIMGRMSAYTGRALSWQWVMQSSALDLRPDEYTFSDRPPQPVAVPGKTPLV